MRLGTRVLYLVSKITQPTNSSHFTLPSEHVKDETRCHLQAAEKGTQP